MSTHRKITYGIGTAFAAVLALMMVPSSSSITEDVPRMYGMAEVTIRNINGDILSSDTLHNAITDDGERAVLNAIFLNQTMDPPVVICMSDVDSGTIDDRELANKTFSHTDEFAPFDPVLPEPAELFRTILVNEVVTIDVPASAGAMTVVDGSVTTINNTEYVTSEETVLPAGSVLIINGRTVTLEFASFVSAGRTVLSVPTTTGFPGVQNVTFASSFTTPDFEYNASEIFFYDIELPDAPPLPLGVTQPPISFNITNATDTVLRVDFNRYAENRTLDRNNNGVIDEGEWEVVYIPQGGAKSPCKSSPAQDDITLTTVYYVRNNTLVFEGDEPNLDNIIDVIPGPSNNTYINATGSEIVNQSIPANTTISVIPGRPAVNVTVNGDQSTAVISVNFTTTNDVSYSAERNDFVNNFANFEPDQPLRTMLICTLDPFYPTDIPAFPDCDLAAGDDGLLFSIIKLTGQSVSEGDIVEASYTFDITSRGS
ncbi:hypothetical protein CENSYa_1320 [Cenarchaeum symbiosum A]|uniref:EF-hand domain-containing protein n=1 Tax=Cenarchaeum symbiosum (strain A) TaxID=414004 RepID=A0RX76_CENSY|nr:hypothetical protein CENSYa_1320 [Cenarchaeum symbiosum A]